jgi:cytoskeletal protein CcmA (bactofilin family)
MRVWQGLPSGEHTFTSLERKELAMWGEKKPQSTAPKILEVASTMPMSPALTKPMTDILPNTSDSPTSGQSRTYLGGSLVLKGDLSAKEDLLIEGQFEGTINLHDHCLTIGPTSQVKAEIHAGRVIVLGSVNGNISARGRIEIRKSGRVAGDLVGPGIAIEDGAYFKGSIEILRPQSEQALSLSSLSTQASA